jgi:hypothetical protein
LVVAMSGRLATRCGVTILTSDLGDLQALVDQTGRSNIAISDVEQP